MFTPTKTKKLKEILEANHIVYMGIVEKTISRKRNPYELIFDYNKRRKFTYFDQFRIEREIAEILDHKVELIGIDEIKPQYQPEYLKATRIFYERDKGGTTRNR